MNPVREISADTLRHANPASKVTPAPSSGSPHTAHRDRRPVSTPGRESYTVPNYATSPSASSSQYSPEPESSPDPRQNHFQSESEPSNYPSAPRPHFKFPSPISDTDCAVPPNDAAWADEEFSDAESLCDSKDALSTAFPPDESSSQSHCCPLCGGDVPPIHRGIQAANDAANDVSLYPIHESRHSDIMIDDKRNLLRLMGCVDYLQDSALISQLFSEKLLASTCSSTSDGALGSKGLCGRPMKAKVSSDAGKAASADRRKVAPSFFCELRGICGASFTRKNGLINHYKAHLGITNKFCQYCSQAFTTSVGRHERKCKQNPDHRPQKPSPSMYMIAPLAGYY